MLLMCYINYYRDHALSQSNIEDLEIIRAVTEIFSCIVFFLVFVIVNNKIEEVTCVESEIPLETKRI